MVGEELVLVEGGKELNGEMSSSRDGHERNLWPNQSNVSLLAEC